MREIHLLIIISTVFIFSACSKPETVDQKPVTNSAPLVQMNEKPQEAVCKTKIVTSSSSQNFIRFSHPTSLNKETSEKALNWCAQYDKSSTLRKQKCGVCCTSSYFCD